MAIAEKPKYKFPKSIGACADALYTIRNARLAVQKQAAEMEEEEKALKLYIINTLPKSEASGVAGKLARVTVITKDVPQLKDEDAFHKWVVKNKAWDCMTKAINKAAIEGRWDAGKKVDGIEAFPVVTVSLNKV